MPVIIIDLNNEILGINTYDVYVSNCVEPPEWQLVADDYTYEQFPVFLLDSAYGITGDCYNYLISGDTGCICTGTGSTLPVSVTPSVTPTITLTPSITPTISVTPSVTPTISVTPSVTPSITSSVTPTPSPTPDTCIPFVLEWSYNDTDACSGQNLSSNTYYTESPFTIGNILYENEDCDTPVSTGRYVLYNGSVYYIEALTGEITLHNC
jgi:hypothetical protein